MAAASPSLISSSGGKEGELGPRVFSGSKSDDDLLFGVQFIVDDRDGSGGVVLQRCGEEQV